MSELNIKRVRELLEKATPGRWMAAQPEPGRPVEVMVRFSEEGTDEDDYNDNDLMLCDTYTGHSGRLAGLLDIDSKKDLRISAAGNANLIAAAPDLARLVLAQAEELARLRTALEWFADDKNWYVMSGWFSPATDEGRDRARAALAPATQGA